MAADPNVVQAAWHLVDVLGRRFEPVIEDRLTQDADPDVSDSAQRLLEMLRRNTAADGTPDRTADLEVWELLYVVAEAALHDGTPISTSSRGPAWQQILHDGHGFPLVSGRTDVAMRLLEIYRDLAPARTLPAVRAALTAWLLSQGRDSLYEILADSHEAARFPAAERAMLLQDAAHLYAWADTQFAAPLMTPYQALYMERHDWLVPPSPETGSRPTTSSAPWARTRPCRTRTIRRHKAGPIAVRRWLSGHSVTRALRSPTC